MGAKGASWLPFETKLAEGARVAELQALGLTFSAIAGRTGMPRVTCWRRYWFWRDWQDRPRGPDGRLSRRIPRLRSTPARPPLHPRRRPDGTVGAKPREMSWLEVHCIWCTACQRWYARPNPRGCPRCGLVPARR
jgi:hypothetical protein